MESHLFIPDKLAYVKGDKPQVKCILCAINEKDPKVTKLDIYHTDHFIVSLNLYPYNPGHLMIFPKKHLIDPRQLSDEQVLELNNLTTMTLNIIEKLYSPNGFNVGYNIGYVSGASIEHLHLHVIPGYKNEIGLIDIIGNARVIVEDPNKTLKKFKEAFKNFRAVWLE
ncbi:MAG: HIT domain-containing protein [bacterium]